MAPVVLVAVLVMWAEPGACHTNLISNPASAPSANCFEFWLNRYQTMVSGLLALSAAVVAYLAARAQIRHAEGLVEKRRQAEEYAARAGLPLALTEVCNYAAACRDIFKSRLLNRKYSSPLELPLFPGDVVEPLQYCIRFSDKDQAKKIADLLSFLQIFQSRVTDSDRWSKMALYDGISDAVVLNLLASDLYDYGRRREEGWMKRPDRQRMGREFENMGLSSYQHPNLFRLVGLEPEPEQEPVLLPPDDDDYTDEGLY